MEERKKTKIEGLEIIPLQTHFDDRGYLFEIIHNYEMSKFGRVYMAADPDRGVIRAFHKHNYSFDNFCIVRGTAKFVFVDDREKSPTYKQQEVIVTSEKSPALIIVPPGIFHGWMSLEDNTALLTVNSELFDKENPDETRIPPDSFGDVWTVKGR
ncbi:MAG: dTDP-4-dehydrorhamnose 3,5-epimerase family protein [bacterium]